MPPLPVFQLLSAQQRALIPFVRSAVRRGLSSNAIIRTVFQAPGAPGIRRTTGLEVIRSVRGTQAFGDRLKFTPRGRAPDPRRIPRALTKTLRDFAFRFSVATEDPVTGLLRTEVRSLARDDVATRATLEDEMSNRMRGDPETYPDRIVGVTLIEAVRSGPSGTVL